MSGVDDRIVAMKFDNAAFERKIKDTLKSLDLLKVSIDKLGSTKGLKELTAQAKQFDVSNVTKGLQNITTASRNVDISNVTEGIAALNTVAKNADLSGITDALKSINSAAAQVKVDPAVDAMGNVTKSADKVDTSGATDAMGDVTKGADQVKTTNAADAMSDVTEAAQKTDTSGATDAMSDVTAASDQVNVGGIVDAVQDITLYANQVNVQGAVAGMQSITAASDQVNVAGAQAAMQNLTTSAQGVDLSAIAHGVQAISDKFTALNLVAGAVLFQIVTKAITAGADIAKALSLDPIMQGFQEYETNMNSIQTILANTKSDGSTLDDVNAALDQLNQYSDKTIYNFSEMAKNIGTFTAAGVNLKDSVDAIKGIANLAAISGSNSGQASTAMYQLSQALAAGKVSLMDWNSVVNAGMGGEIFKKALFETGKAMKTINDVPLDTTFEQWEKKGGTFREQMQKGWITADVLKTTLGAFSGEMDASALSALGFSDAAAQEMEDLGKLGIESATQVKTVTQLMGTIKESIASGWSLTFRTVVGDFGEAKKLFTDINNVVGKWVGASADARNNMLAGWRFFGGRELLLDSLKKIFHEIGMVISRVSLAFREFFPRTTAVDLFNLTQSFANFADKLSMSGTVLEDIRHIFRGFFSSLQVGMEIIKGIGSVFVDLFGGLAGSGEFIDTLAGGARSLADFNKALIESGAIADFFDKVGKKVRDFVTEIKGFVDTILGAGGWGEAIGAVEGGAKTIGDAAGDAYSGWEKLVGFFQGILHSLGGVFEEIKTFFVDFKDKVKDAIMPKDFDPVLDAVNVGLLGGIALMMKRFLDNGLKINLGTGFLHELTGGMAVLTETLKAMQTELKARALQKIAIAIGILAASILVLSTMDPGELATTLAAMATGLTQLMLALNTINLMSSAPLKMNAIATALILLSGALLVFSLAVRSMAALDAGELAKGLVGVGAALAMLVAVTHTMDKRPGAILRTSIAMVAMATALRIMAEAVQAFATMSWEELGRGLAGLAGSLAILVAAMNLMPPTALLAAGLAMIPLAVGLGLLSLAVMSFATIAYDELFRGLAGIAGSLVIIAGAMHLMPLTLPITAAGLILVSIALNGLVLAVRSMATMDFGTMAKGLGGLAVMLAILAIAMNAMSGTILGAGALVLVTAALFGLTLVLNELSTIPAGQLVKGLLALSAVLLIIGGAGYLLTGAAVGLLAFGAAMLMVGGAVALFGLGMSAIANAIKTFSKHGAEAMESFIQGAILLVKAIPLILAGLVMGFQELGVAVIEMLTVLIGKLPPLVRNLVTLISTFIGSMLKSIRERFPEFVETGFTMLLSILRGIRDNIDEILTLGVEIMMKLASSLIKNMPVIVGAMAGVIQAFVHEVSKKATELTAAGLQLLSSLLLGIAQNINKVVEAATIVIIAFLAEVAGSVMRIVEAGTNILLWLLQGISDNITKVVEGVTEIITTFLHELTENYGEIVDAGFNLLKEMLKGIGENLVEVVNTVGTVVTEFITALGDKAEDLIRAGAEALIQVLDGIEDELPRVITKGTDVIIAFIKGIGSNAIRLADAAFVVLTDFLNGLAAVIRNRDEEIMDAGINVASAIIDGIVKGIGKFKDKVFDVLLDMAKSAWKKVTSFWEIFSPSKKFMWIGEMLMKGLAIGIDDNSGLAGNSAVQAAEKIVSDFHESIKRMPEGLPGVDISPTIKPVLDLTQVQAAARGINSLLGVDAIVPVVSIDRARQIATTTEQANEGSESAAPVNNEYVYNQTINSPRPLSTGDIYRNSKSLIATKKEELDI